MVWFEVGQRKTKMVQRIVNIMERQIDGEASSTAHGRCGEGTNLNLVSEMRCMVHFQDVGKIFKPLQVQGSEICSPT